MRAALRTGGKQYECCSSRLPMSRSAEALVPVRCGVRCRLRVVVRQSATEFEDPRRSAEPLRCYRRDSAELEMARRAQLNGFADQDRGPVLLVERLQASCEVHDRAQHRIRHAVSRSDGANDRLTRMQSET